MPLGRGTASHRKHYLRGENSKMRAPRNQFVDKLEGEKKMTPGAKVAVNEEPSTSEVEKNGLSALKAHFRRGARIFMV